MKTHPTAGTWRRFGFTVMAGLRLIGNFDSSAGRPPTRFNDGVEEDIANANLCRVAPGMKETLEEVSVGLQTYLENHGDQDGRLVGMLKQVTDTLDRVAKDV